MKKWIALFLTFLLCLPLVACKNDPVGGTTAGTDNSTTSPDTSTTEDTAAGIPIGTVDVQTLREGNWNSAAEADGNFEVWFLAAEGGYYYIRNGFLYFYDPSSNISVILCQKVGCLHEKGETYKIRKTCEAHIPADNFFVYDDGYLYYDENDRGQQIYRRNIDGTGEKHIATLCESHIDGKHEAQMVSCCVSDGVLYYSVLVSTVELDQNGSLVSKDAYHALMRLDLTTGKEKEIMRTVNASIGIIAAKKDAVLYNTMSLAYYDAPNVYEAMLNTPRYFYLWTQEENVSQELLCKPRKEYGSTLSFDRGEVIVWTNEPEGYYSYDFVTGEQQHLDRPGYIKLNDNLYFNDVASTFYDASGKEYPNAFLDLSGTKYNDLQIFLFAMGEHGVIVELNYRLVTEPDEQGHATIIAQAVYYSYVTYEALADGFQPEDVTVFLSWEET